MNDSCFSWSNLVFRFCRDPGHSNLIWFRGSCAHRSSFILLLRSSMYHLPAGSLSLSYSAAASVRGLFRVSWIIGIAWKMFFLPKREGHREAKWVSKIVPEILGWATPGPSVGRTHSCQCLTGRLTYHWRNRRGRVGQAQVER